VINSDGGYAPKEHRPIRQVAIDRPIAAVFFHNFSLPLFAPIFLYIFFGSSGAIV